jgi:hypothetical protein
MKELTERTNAMTLTLERLPSNAYVAIGAYVVHARACHFWRMGTRHGPCTCGGNEAWERLSPDIRKLLGGEDG